MDERVRPKALEAISFEAFGASLRCALTTLRCWDRFVYVARLFAADCDAQRCCRWLVCIMVVCAVLRVVDGGGQKARGGGGRARRSRQQVNVQVLLISCGRRGRFEGESLAADGCHAHTFKAANRLQGLESRQTCRGTVVFVVINMVFLFECCQVQMFTTESPTHGGEVGGGGEPSPGAVSLEGEVAAVSCGQTIQHNYSTQVSHLVLLQDERRMTMCQRGPCIKMSTNPASTSPGVSRAINTLHKHV